jgi:Icc-related predicted phosphoesterase
VICGHIHEPKIETVTNEKGKTLYLNSGDWIENLTALEYDKKQWKLYRHDVNTIAVVDEYDFKRENKLAEEFITFLK